MNVCVFGAKCKQPRLFPYIGLAAVVLLSRRPCRLLTRRAFPQLAAFEGPHAIAHPPTPNSQFPVRPHPRDEGGHPLFLCLGVRPCDSNLLLLQVLPSVPAFS